MEKGMGKYIEKVKPMNEHKLRNPFKTYDQYETEEYSKPRKVIKSMKHFSKPKFKVDVLKVELPVDIRLVEGYAEDYNISRKDAKKYFKQQARASHLPYIFLSAGVSPELFRESLILARDNGSKYNGVLCGRATWAGVVKEYLEYGEDAARKWLQTEGRNNLKEFIRIYRES